METVLCLINTVCFNRLCEHLGRGTAALCAMSGTPCRLLAARGVELYMWRCFVCVKGSCSDVLVIHTWVWLSHSVMHIALAVCTAHFTSRLFWKSCNKDIKVKNSSMVSIHPRYVNPPMELAQRLQSLGSTPQARLSLTK